ncbi:RIP metalloprotease RseP [Helicobacter cinaedi]|uniref:Zinc metalloprotease n=1 Tax=Helicobacter cinaedi CCUG 18818 = ATCC BAA-847 TaxID=537971 RepID=A0AAI8MM52_9HELI|nr:RIP metalloprotease RseP [Helicobacter cinaedi]EFR46656.1 RIP metalloprotease RseP [Helicobacter cinaedi CCUG 18818 = ATCC BAA-847]QOQ91794.1 RIP metalloprotease RseP [Helicobacter cinaedi]BAM32118.1 membrane-associated zinc metalloprotease [Helicobacter cinaedi CCUG 18818 = ATCC BAA-847]
MSIFIALLILSFLVFFHELGHFIVARICGVKVEVFSIGFGKKLVSWQFRQTEYVLSMIPLGGYVKLKGQDDSNPKLKNYEADSYLSKSPWQRIAILLAGPFFNLFLAFLLYMAVGLLGKVSLLPVVGEVKENYPAVKAGIKAGDVIVAINGKEIKTWEELDSMIIESQGELELKIQRGQGELKESLRVRVLPMEQEAQNIFRENITRKIIGISSAGAVGMVHYKGLDSIVFGIDESIKASTLIAQSIIKLISGVVPSSEVGGVVSIVSVISAASSSGLTHLLWLTALISVNLGILNLLPIPALDGGHIIFNLYEVIMRKAPSENVAYYLTLCGWAVLLGLMLLGLYNDIFRLLA